MDTTITGTLTFRERGNDGRKVIVKGVTHAFIATSTNGGQFFNIHCAPESFSVTVEFHEWGFDKYVTTGNLAGRTRPFSFDGIEVSISGDSVLVVGYDVYHLDGEKHGAKWYNSANVVVDEGKHTINYFANANSHAKHLSAKVRKAYVDMQGRLLFLADLIDKVNLGSEKSIHLLDRALKGLNDAEDTLDDTLQFLKFNGLK